MTATIFDPASDEAVEVRREECQHHGHRLELIDRDGRPTVVICPNCGAVWDVSPRRDEVADRLAPYNITRLPRFVHQFTGIPRHE